MMRRRRNGLGVRKRRWRRRWKTASRRPTQSRWSSPTLQSRSRGNAKTEFGIHTVRETMTAGKQSDENGHPAGKVGGDRQPAYERGRDRPTEDEMARRELGGPRGSSELEPAP